MRGKLLGIDYGTKRVGVAISDEERKVAFPKVVLKNDSNLLGKVMDMCEQEDVAGIVLGESTDYKGDDNPVMEEIRAFRSKLESELDMPIYFEPEFLTTAQAARGQEERKELDAAAAAIILRSFLEKQHTDKDE